MLLTITKTYNYYPTRYVYYIYIFKKLERAIFTHCSQTISPLGAKLHVSRHAKLLPKNWDLA